MKSTKKSLALSILSLVICVTMLLGTTFAWFTDSVTSGSNKIVAGNLDVALVMWDGAKYTDISDKDAAIFGPGSIAQNNSAETLWEPGKTQIVFLGVKNNGNLALKYNIVLKVTDGGLIGALEYAILDGVEATTAPAVANWAALKAAAAGQTADLAAGSFKAAEGGVLDEIANGTTGETDYFALAVHMKEEADNKYQEKDVTIDVQVVATQTPAEADSFDNQYDKDVLFPVEFAKADPSNVNEIIAALEPNSTVILTANEESYKDLVIPADLKEGITIKADDGAKLDSIVIPENAQLKDLTIDNVHYDLTSDSNLITVGGNAVLDNVVFENCEVVASNGNKYNQKLIEFKGDSGTVTFKDCEILNIGRGIHSVQNGFGPDTTINLIGCTIKNSGSWIACDQSGTSTKAVYIEGCTFENVDGLIKIQGGGCQDFTFINNTILPNEDDPAVYHYYHDFGKPAGSIGKTFSITVHNSLTVYGNKIGDQPWDPTTGYGINFVG